MIGDFYKVWWFFLYVLVIVFVLSLVASGLIALLVPYHSRPEQEKKRYQTVLNVLLLVPPVFIQFYFWGQAILLTFPNIKYPGVNILNLLMFPITTWYDVANAVAECIVDTTEVASLNDETIIMMAISYLLLLIAYGIINAIEHIRNNRKEQSS